MVTLAGKGKEPGKGWKCVIIPEAEQDEKNINKRKAVTVIY